MTLAAIGKRAGYSYGLVTQRFGSKDGLMWAMVESMIVDWSRRPPRRNAATSLLSQWRPVLEGLRASAAKDPVSLRALWAVMFEAVKPGTTLNERVRELHRNQREGTARSIRREIESGRIPADFPPDATAAILISVLRGLAYQWLLDPEFDYDAAVEALELLIARLTDSPDAASNRSDDVLGSAAASMPEVEADDEDASS